MSSRASEAASSRAARVEMAIRASAGVSWPARAACTRRVIHTLGLGLFGLGLFGFGLLGFGLFGLGLLGLDLLDLFGLGLFGCVGGRSDRFGWGGCRRGWLGSDRLGRGRCDGPGR